MTVRELMGKLIGLDPDLEVYLEDWTQGYDSPKIMYCVEVYTDYVLFDTDHEDY